VTGVAEPSFAEARIKLYAGHDVDYNSATPIVDNILSETTGIYTFNISSAGDYTIRVTTAASYEQDMLAGSCAVKAQIGLDNMQNSWELSWEETNIVVDNGTMRDWTSKLIKTTTQENELEHVEFTFGKYAKTNILDYKLNDSNPINSSDYIEVDNYNLEEKQDLVRLQLAAPQVEKLDSRMIAYWLYDAKKDRDTLIFSTEYAGGSNNDIVCKLALNPAVSQYEAIYPIDMQFNGTTGLKAQYYTEYQKLVRKPRFIKEKFRMMPYDLQGYDPEIPIYLAQYGKYYAVMTMQVGSDLIAECELLELKEI
jgi:hypothetical protein